VGGVLAKAENRFDVKLEPEFLELLAEFSLDLTGDLKGGVLPLIVLKSPQSMPFEDERRGGGDFVGEPMDGRTMDFKSWNLGSRACWGRGNVSVKSSQGHFSAGLTEALSRRFLASRLTLTW
jgi:hypothetical protein